MSSISLGNRTIQSISENAHSVAISGLGIAFLGVAASSLATVVGGLFLAAVAALVRYLYPLTPRSTVQEPWNFSLENPNGKETPVEKRVWYQDHEFVVSLRPSLSDNPRSYSIFIDDRPLLKVLAPWVERRAPPQQWVLTSACCRFEATGTSGAVLYITDPMREDPLGGSALSMNHLILSSDSSREVFPHRWKNNREHLVALGNPISEKEAKQCAASHLANAELAAYHSRMGFVTCAHFQTPFFFRAAPEERAGRVLDKGEYNYSIVADSYSSRTMQINHGHEFELQLQLQVEKDRTLTVWLNQSPAQFLPGSAIQSDSLLPIDAATGYFLPTEPSAPYILPPELVRLIIRYVLSPTLQGFARSTTPTAIEPATPPA
jgi:hypothetical protein